MAKVVSSQNTNGSNVSIEKYKIVLDLTKNEGIICWQINSVFIVLHVAIVGFLVDKFLSDNNFMNNYFLIIFLISLLGLITAIFWFTQYWRRSKYYEFRMAQTRELEKRVDKKLQLICGKGEEFSSGKEVIIDEKAYRLGFLIQLFRPRRTNSIFIILFIIFYLCLLLYSGNLLLNFTCRDILKNICQ